MVYFVSFNLLGLSFFNLLVYFTWVAACPPTRFFSSRMGLLLPSYAPIPNEAYYTHTSWRHPTLLNLGPPPPVLWDEHISRRSQHPVY